MRILSEARAKAETQVRAIHEHNRTALRLEGKRMTLKVREELLRRVIERARERLAALSEGSGYRRVLLDWVVEAAIGLNVPEAVVNASALERGLLDQALLREAEAEVKQLTGRNLSLRLAAGDPLVGQGVVLKSADGRVEFNNQVSTRLLRYQSEIRKAVQGLFEARS